MSETTIGVVRSMLPSDVDGVISVLEQHLSDEGVSDRLSVIQQAANGNESKIGIVSEYESNVIGFVIITFHDKQSRLGDYITRPVPYTPTEKYAILRYTYVSREFIGEGFGTRMVDEAISHVKREDVEEVLVEAWHRHTERDLRPLLDRFGFTPVYVSDSYWSHPAVANRQNDCPDCGTPTVECKCAGGVYQYSLAN